MDAVLKATHQITHFMAVYDLESVCEENFMRSILYGLFKCGKDPYKLQSCCHLCAVSCCNWFMFQYLLLKHVFKWARAAPKVLPTVLFCWPTTWKLDVDGMAEEVLYNSALDITLLIIFPVVYFLLVFFKALHRTPMSSVCFTLCYFRKYSEHIKMWHMLGWCSKLFWAAICGSCNFLRTQVVGLHCKAESNTETSLFLSFQGNKYCKTKQKDILIG